MCGIIGVIGTQDVAEKVFRGMLSLQHRGQDASGITSYNGRFKTHKGAGLVESLYSEEILKTLSGTMALGHTRYPTHGSDCEAQPFFVNHPYGVAMVNNGNIINYPTLQQYLKVTHRRIMETDNDLEAMLNLFATALDKQDFTPDLVFAAIREVYRRANGGYSVLALIGDHGLVAFKDPKGIRPLVMGELDSAKGKGFAFASEDSALRSMDYRHVRDLAAGEAVFIDMDLNVHRKVLEENYPTPCMFEWVYFARPESVIADRGVYPVRLELGRQLAKKLKHVKADLVIPVPDTSRTAAIALAEALKIPYREGLIKNRYIGRTFIMSSQRARENAVRLKLNPVISEIRNKDLIVVDDSLVRGTTARNIIQLLRDCGAKSVCFVSTCPPIRHPCYYGIDFPLASELIGSGRDVDAIRREIGADELIYLDLNSLKKVLGNHICHACLDGTYPTTIFEASEFEGKRRRDRNEPEENVTSEHQ